MKKKLLLALSLGLMITFTGCSSDEDSSTTSIVGKWKSEKFDYYTNGVLDETVITVEENSSCPDYVEFKSNGTYVSIENDVNCNATADASGTYTYNGTNIFYNSWGVTESITVISLTSSRMKYDITETSSEGIVYKTVGYLKKIN